MLCSKKRKGETAMNNAAEQKKVLTLGDSARERESFDERFPILRVSTLSLNDSFLKYDPLNLHEESLKDSIISLIKEGLEDFRTSAIDLSFDEEGNYIAEKGKPPAIGESAVNAEEKLKAFMPEKNSKMATLPEFHAKLALLMKFLMEERNLTVEQVWKLCCFDSSKIAHCKNSKNAKKFLEPTGSRKVWKLYDWGNIWKLVKDDTACQGYSIVGTYYAYEGKVCPLSYRLETSFPEQVTNYETPMLHLDV